MGARLGLSDGDEVGESVGFVDGASVGDGEGLVVGAAVGSGVGEEVIVKSTSSKLLISLASSPILLVVP